MLLCGINTERPLFQQTPGFTVLNESPESLLFLPRSDRWSHSVLLWYRVAQTFSPGPLLLCSQRCTSTVSPLHKTLHRHCVLTVPSGPVLSDVLSGVAAKRGDSLPPSILCWSRAASCQIERSTALSAHPLWLFICVQLGPSVSGISNCGINCTHHPCKVLVYIG